MGSPMADDEQLLDTWRIHARVVLYVLGAADPAALTAKPLKGRTAGEQFAHLHNVRLMWLGSAAPDLGEGLVKLVKEDAGNVATLRSALVASGERVEALVARALETGRVKGFKPHPAAFVGYLVSHESYHQGDIGVRLTEAGAPLPKKVGFGMWEWGVR